MAQPAKKKTTGTVSKRPSPVRADERDATVRAAEPVRGSTPPGGEAAPRRPGSSGMIPIPSPSPSPNQRAPGGTSRQQAGMRESNRNRSTSAKNQIGGFRLKGWPMAVKFTIAISLLVIIALTIYGWLFISKVESGKYDDIVRSGYDQVLQLKFLAETALNTYRVQKDLKKLDTYNSYIKEVTDRDPRIFDIVLFYTPAPNEKPMALMQVKEAKSFLLPENSKRKFTVNVPNADPSIVVYEGPYRAAEMKVERTEQCLYFRMPIQVAVDPKETTKPTATLNLIMSSSEIREEVSALRTQLLMVGVLLAALGVGIALALAYFTANPIRSLVKDMNEVAHGNFDFESEVAQTSHDEVGLLASAFNAMTQSLRLGRESELENQRISGELNTAKAIHIKLMPEKLPQLPGIDIFTAYQSAKEVGGDYYDFIPVGDADHLALCVADVSGKGIPGSMVMGTTRTILRMMAVGNLSPADVLAKTNYHVARDIKRGMFVTCVYCILNVRSREMAVASAGHNPMLIHRAATGKLEKIRPNGIALGFDKGPVFNRTIREERIQLEPGDRVVLYTDGIVEAMNENREEFSEEALDQFTLDNAELPSKDFVRQLIKVLEEHKGAAEQHDDITVTTFRIVS